MTVKMNSLISLLLGGGGVSVVLKTKNIMSHSDSGTNTGIIQFLCAYRKEHGKFSMKLSVKLHFYPKYLTSPLTFMY